MHDEISPSAFDHGEEPLAVRAEVDKIVAVMNAKPKSYAKVAATQLTRPKRKPALKRQSRPKETPPTHCDNEYISCAVYIEHIEFLVYLCEIVFSILSVSNTHSVVDVNFAFGIILYYSCHRTRV